MSSVSRGRGWRSRSKKEISAAALEDYESKYVFVSVAISAPW